jgi:hypothetical protein
VIALNAAEAARKIDLTVSASSQRKKRILLGQAEIEAQDKILRLTIPPRSGVVVKI